MSRKNRLIHLLSRHCGTSGASHFGRRCQAEPFGASHFEAVQGTDFEGVPGASRLLEQILYWGQKVKLRSLGGNFFLRCIFETFRPMVLIVERRES